MKKKLNEALPKTKVEPTVSLKAVLEAIKVSTGTDCTDEYYACRANGMSVKDSIISILDHNI